MFEKFKDVSFYEDEIRKVKKEHFARVSDLENENHKLKNELAEIGSAHKIVLKEQELKYEQLILSLKHQLELEKERIGLLKEKAIFEAEREIGKKKEAFSSERYDKMEELLEKEKDTLRSVLEFTMNKLPEAKQFNVEANGKFLTGSVEGGKENGAKG